MSVNITSVAVSGIAAAEAEIAATESNISNASNPNYSAESVVLAAAPGAQGQGIGVEVLGTQRAQAPFLTGQIDSAQSSASFNQAFTQATTLAQNYISPSGGTDLSGYLQDLFNSFTTLSASPTDPSARTAAISAATNFAQASATLSGNLQQTAGDQLAQLGTLVSQVNNITQQVAALNSQVQSTQAQGGSAAALLDQRDGLVAQLSQLIGATADSAGNVTVNGVPLVSGANALTLSTTGTGVNVGLQVTLTHGTLPLQPAQLGGSIGGVISGAASVLQAQSSLNGFATSVAGAINSVYSTGYGLDGSTGNTLFVVPGTSGAPISINPAVTEQNFAAAASAAGVPGDGSNAAALANLAAATNLDSAAPSETLGQAFTAIASQFGSTVANATTNQQQATATLTSLQTLQSSITGVSLNDQLTHLVQYQNALEAAGRALQSANDITQYLIQVSSQ
ncbi:MAG TPA: flagellar hook-associated protein FlgK [Candidatus Binataceae bacterium]|nr:flagellar hook-associated protein FlgK [Candidatus Binataceae bacterium]